MLPVFSLGQGPGCRPSLGDLQPSGMRGGTGRALVVMKMNSGGFRVGGFWVIRCHLLLPPRCRTYGSIPFARLQPKTPYNASWSSLATSLILSPQSSGPRKLRQKQHPQKWPTQRKGSQHSSKVNATALQAPMASPGPDTAPITWLEVTHPRLQEPRGGIKPQGELKI